MHRYFSSSKYGWKSPQPTAFFFIGVARTTANLRCLGWTTARGSDKQLCDATAAWRQQGAMYQAMHTAVEKNRALNWQSRRSMPCFCTERSVRCKLHLWPARRTGLMGLQPYVSTSLRAFQIAVLLQIAQSQFVSVESHSSVFFLLCVLVAMVSKTCYFLIVFFK